MADLKKEFQYFLDHQEELVEKYNNKVLVIVGENVVGSYDSTIAALNDAQSKYKDGTYLIQKCTRGESAYTQVFHSRAAFV